MKNILIMMKHWARKASAVHSNNINNSFNLNETIELMNINNWIIILVKISLVKYDYYCFIRFILSRVHITIAADGRLFL